MSRSTASLGKEGVLGNETLEIGSYGKDTQGRKECRMSSQGLPPKERGCTGERVETLEGAMEP